MMMKANPCSKLKTIGSYLAAMSVVAAVGVGTLFLAAKEDLAPARDHLAPVSGQSFKGLYFNTDHHTVSGFRRNAQGNTVRMDAGVLWVPREGLVEAFDGATVRQVSGEITFLTNGQEWLLKRSFGSGIPFLPVKEDVYCNVEGACDRTLTVLGCAFDTELSPQGKVIMNDLFQQTEQQAKDLVGEVNKYVAQAKADGQKAVTDLDRQAAEIFAKNVVADLSLVNFKDEGSFFVFTEGDNKEESSYLVGKAYPQNPNNVAKLKIQEDISTQYEKMDNAMVSVSVDPGDTVDISSAQQSSAERRYVVSMILDGRSKLFRPYAYKIVSVHDVKNLEILVGIPGFNPPVTREQIETKGMIVKGNARAAIMERQSPVRGLDSN